MKKNFGIVTCMVLVVTLCGCGVVSQAGRGRDLGDLKIPPERLPQWYPGVEGGIPNTSDWPVFCEVTDPPYNAKPNDDKSDAAAINAAITAAATAGGNQVVYLPAGLYRFDKGQAIYMKSNVVLRGAGWDDTIIKGKGSKNQAGIYFSGSRGGYINITSSSIPKGTTTITLADASGIGVGDWLFMEQDNDPSYMQWDVIPAMTAIFKVVAKNGNTITMDRPLRHAFGSSFNPVVFKIKPIENAGIEKFRIQMDRDSNVKANLVVIKEAVNCWTKEVYFKDGGKHHIFLNYAVRNTIFKCMFEGLLVWEINKTPWANYSIGFAEGAHDNLITNTVAIDNKSNACFARGASGNVYSYNYHVGTVMRKGVQFHGKYPYDNLVEGNDTYNGIMTMDNNWGQQGPRNTIFRNRCRGIGRIHSSADGPESPPDCPTGVDLNLILNSAHSFYGGCVGPAVCNYPKGNTRDYDFKSTGLWAEYNFATDIKPDVGGVWGWVWKTPESSSVRIESDHEGNKAPAHWAGLKFPASLYLKNKPDWWPAGKAWPCIGADIDDHSGAMIKLPAQQWYEALPNKPWPKSKP